MEREADTTSDWGRFCLVGVGISAGSAAVVRVIVLFRVSVMSADSETEESQVN